MNSKAKKKKKHKKCKGCSSWVGHWMTSCPSCGSSCDHGASSDSVSDSGSSDGGGGDGGMSSVAWVRANCKFAMELPPVTPSPAPAPQQQPPLDPFLQMQNAYIDSLQSFVEVSRDDNTETESIEEDRFDPGSQYGHYTESVGAYNSHTATMIIKGRVYWPDALAQDESMTEIGGLAENLINDFNENPPDVITDVNHMWEERNSQYTILSATRAGDWYNVTIKCDLSGETPYERPEREYEPDF